MAAKRFDRGRIESLTAALEAQFGLESVSAGDTSRQVEIVRAPAVVDLMGDHMDQDGGFVLAVAIELETWIAFRSRRDGRVRLVSRSSPGLRSFWIDALVPPRDAAAAPVPTPAGDVDPTGEYVAATAWSLRETALPIRGFDGFVDSTIPVGVGSRAASLELAATVALLGEGAATAPALAALAQRGERDYLGLDSGIVDQFVCAAGRQGRALMLDCRSLDVRYVPLPFGVRVVVCDTGSGVDRDRSIYEARRAESARAVALLAERMPGLSSLRDLEEASLRRHRSVLPEKVARRAEHVVSENARVVETAAALETGDLDELGRLFSSSHVSLGERYEVGSPAVEAMVEVASSIPGVLASRMTGSGFGGCTVHLVLADAIPALEAAVSREYSRRTGLTGQVYPVEVVTGAGRVKPPVG